MQYRETIARSAELLREALPLMSRQAAALHPHSYALWYAYVSASGTPLRLEVDAHLARHGALDEVVTDTLYRRHVAGSDMEAAQQVTEGLTRVIGGVSAQAALATDHASRFGQTLERLAGVLADTPADAPPEHSGSVLDELLSHTQQMRAGMARLQQRLAESQREIEQLRHEVRQAREESLVDALTSLANRRAFDQRLAAALGGGAPSLVLADLDHFKRINDRYGHGFGDQVLRSVGQVVHSLVPDGALGARVGGEEFAVLLPAAPVDAAGALAERLRQRVATSRVHRKGDGEVVERVTISLGVAVARQGDTAQALFDRADRALYASKTAGRDRSTIVR